MGSLGDEELLAEMRSALEQVQAASDRVRQQVQQAKITVRDKERLLSVTVGGQGELQQLTFHGDAYRRLAPAELADLIVKTAGRARDDAQRKLMASTAALTDDLPRLHDTARQAASVDELIEGIVGMVSAAGDGSPGAGRTA
ncbi:YbaB/EbfC family nucleoid-associated protein [Micromonospora rubida]|uniref:YbaB/EbfC family nucleoid-associated protein n=1 Tax=Micromonospora rubida TaxID=2697657 RepID=UPI001378ADBB|nr:YbaB/EbfC family nucleoid-associated protein [Micromonospora rubida]NBE80118.1 YbaB/EbfC family DNA-binding protein [Micromonospora rubida]